MPYPKNRAKRYDDPVVAFFAKIKLDPDTGCWLWTACKDYDGYAIMTVNRKARRAHRWGYELINGRVPDGLQLDHLCRNRGCVNPKHLEPVTNRENQIRGEGISAINARKTHCPKGHPLSGDNLLRYLSLKGVRSCATCARARIAQQRKLQRLRVAS